MLTVRRNFNDPIFDIFFKMFDDSLIRNSKNTEIGDNIMYYNISSFVDAKNNQITTMPIPGVKPEDVTVSRDDKFIYIECKLLNRSSNQGEKYSKSYKLTADRNYDISSLSANVENGMLELTLKPKSRATENQMIEVKVNQK